MGTVVAFARASHFGPTVAVTAFTGLLAAGAGRGAGTVWTVAAVLAGQLSVGWSNDWVDRERDRRVDRAGKPLVEGSIADRTLVQAAMAALAAALGLSLLSGVPAAAAHAAAVGLAWSYNFGLKSTPLSPLPYAGAFALLPMFVTLAPPGRALPPLWAVVAGGLLGAGAHFTNTLADTVDDATTGVRGLPQRLGPRTSIVVAAGLLAAGAAAVWLGAPRPLPAAATVALAAATVLVVAVGAAGAVDRGRLAFALTVATAGAVVVAFVSVGV